MSDGVLPSLRKLEIGKDGDDEENNNVCFDGGVLFDDASSGCWSKCGRVVLG